MWNLSLPEYLDKLVRAKRMVAFSCLVLASSATACSRGLSEGRPVAQVMSSTSSAASTSGYSVVGKDRAFPSIQSSLTGTASTVPIGVLDPVAVMSRVPAKEVANFGVLPTLSVGRFTDQNDVGTQRSGVRPYGLIDRLVWVVMYDQVPGSKAPSKSGPATMEKTATVQTKTAASPNSMMVMYVFDAVSGVMLETVVTPEP